MLILDGKEVSQKLRKKIAEEIQTFKFQKGIVPGLTVILVGEDPASQVYVKNKSLACLEVGIESKEIRLPQTVDPLDLKKIILELNSNPKVHGILLQLPLPNLLSSKVSSEKAMDWIAPEKDPDSLTTFNLGLCWKGHPIVQPCTPSGVMEILKHYKIPTKGKRAVVVGRSQIVGRPMAQLLDMADATVTVVHSKTENARSITAEADIIVVAAGKPRLLGREDFKKGAVVIDVGIHRTVDSSGKTTLCGDVRFEELDGWAYAATPVPGGVGPMTITMLLQNTLNLASQQS